MKNEAVRKLKYRQLRRAGFTSREANLMKDYSAKHVQALIRLKIAERSKITEYLKRGK